MRLFKGLPNLSINVLCLILVIIQLVYSMSVHGFSHINSQFILNSIFAFSLFIGSILFTVLLTVLIVIFYVLKKLDILEGKFKDNISTFSDIFKDINIKKS